MTAWLLDKLWVKTAYGSRRRPDDRILFIPITSLCGQRVFLLTVRAACCGGDGEWTTTALGVAGIDVPAGRCASTFDWPATGVHGVSRLRVNEGEYKVMGMAPPARRATPTRSDR
jgi:hypothetical protein